MKSSVQEAQATEEAPQQETESEEQVELEADSDLLDHLDAVEDEAEEEIKRGSCRTSQSQS